MYVRGGVTPVVYCYEYSDADSLATDDSIARHQIPIEHFQPQHATHPQPHKEAKTHAEGL